MSAIIVHTHAGGPVDGSGATTEDHQAPLPMRLRLAHFINPASVASTPHRQPAGYRLAGLRADGRDHCGNPLRRTSYRTARIFNSCRRQGPGSLTSSARIQFLAEQFRSEAPIHDEILSAGSSGLVGAVYGHHSAERKQACPTKEFPGAEIVFPITR